MAWRLTLALLPETYAVCRLPPEAPLPAWVEGAPFASITRTRDELSIVAPQANVPDGVQAETGWRCLGVEGPFALDGIIGVLAALAVPLAAAEISIFVVSTYDTDHLLLKDAHLQRAIEVLARAGHSVRRGRTSMDETASTQPTITPGQVDGESLAWNDETERCADCGTTVEPESGYKLYAGGGPTILCASCYQRRVAADDGGSTHDLTAEVDGGSG